MLAVINVVVSEQHTFLVQLTCNIVKYQRVSNCDCLENQDCKQELVSKITF